MYLKDIIRGDRDMKQIKDKVKCERAIEKLELEKEFDTQNLEFQIYQ